MKKLPLCSSLSSQLSPFAFLCWEKLLLASACARVISICYLITRIYDGMRGGILTHPIWGQLRRTEFLSICGFSFLFFQKRNGSSQALAHEAWHGLIEVRWLRHLDAISEKARRFITFNKRETFNEWEAKLPAGSATGRWIYTCAWVCSVFLKKGIRMKVAFWNRENTKMPKRCFPDKCISLQKLPGFPGGATHRGSTICLSCCHVRGEHSLGTGQNRTFLRTGWKTRSKNWSQEAADHPRPGKTLRWVRS